MFGRQFKVPPSVEFQPPVPLFSDDFFTTCFNNLRKAYTLVRKLNKTEKDRKKVRFDKKSIVPDFKVGESVFMKVCERVIGLDKEHWKGPYPVEEIVSPENMRLHMPDSWKNPLVHVNHLKRDKADQPCRIKPSVVRVLDKMRTRNAKGRLDTRYFVELNDGTTNLWTSDDSVPDTLLEEFNRV